MRDTVAIVGSHPRTRSEFLFDRTDCDVWVFNEAAKQDWVKRADAVFQMHEEAIWKNPGNRNDPEHYQWLQTQTEIPVYMQEQYPDVPMSVKYPLEEITARFDTRYFTSSVTYALALACHLGYRRLELYGVEMETNTEYQYQRDGVTFWLGIAKGLGITVDPHISMFDAPLYGYEGEVVIPYERFAERIATFQPHLNNLTLAYGQALVEADKAINAFDADASAENEKALYLAFGKLRQAGEELGVVDGAIQENKRYQEKADKMREAAGEFLFSRQEFEGSAAGLNQKIDKARTEYIMLGTQLQGAHAGVKHSAKGSKKREQFMDSYVQLLKLQMAKNNEVAVYRGAQQENMNYMNWLDQHIRAAGGAKSEAVLLERQNA